MAGSPAPAALSVAETRAAEALLGRALGGETAIIAAEEIWGRGHVIRLHLGGGSSAVLKRRGGPDHRRRDRGFGAELAALEFLSAMSEPIAPRLLGADTRAGLLVMEDLSQGPSLADSLLTGERERARTDLVAYARALGTLHVWSMGRAGELAGLLARYAPGAPTGPRLERAVKRGKKPFLDAAAALGLATGGAAREIGELPALLAGASPSGLVHGDPCPDNVRVLGDGCRIFDFETSSWGPVVLDAAYLLAPFPTCWCFASLPADAAAPALEAYRGCLAAAGAGPGADWDAAVAAALACWLVGRGERLAGLLEEDPEWGTTTLRPRLLAWLRSFTGQAARAGVLPRLRALAGELHDQLSRRWPDLVIPEYPALAQPGSALARVPGWWQPGL